MSGHPKRRKDDGSYWRATGVIPRWQLLAVYVLIVAAGAAGFWQTSSVANRADDFARDVQSQRVVAIRANCQEQNQRHDDTIRTLDHLIARIPPGAGRDRALANRRGTVLLIDALAPKRDCGRAVMEATRTP